MGPKPKKRILVIEDQPNWQDLIGELIQEVADEIGCAIEVVIATRFVEALKSIAATFYDCVTVDNALPDGKMARALIDRIGNLGYRVPVVVVSGQVKPSDVGDFFQDYRIDGFFWKGEDFEPKKFKNTLARLLAPVKKGEELQGLQRKERGDRLMDWNTIISLAVSAVSPYAVAFATSAATVAGKELVETASESIKRLWQWINQTISKSNDKSARKVWEGFKKDPRSNKDALVDAIWRLSPDDDTVLRGYVRGLIQEVQLRKGALLFSLLDNPDYYTFNDLKRICSRVSPQWEGETGPPTREGLARWVVTYVPTRNRQQDLIAAMLEVNPTVMLQ